MLQPVLKKTTSGVLRGIFGESVVLPEWTHIYEGLTTFGELYSTWQSSGNDWEVEVEVYFPEKDGFNRVLLGTDLSITGSDNPDLTWDGNNGAIYVQDKSGAFFVLGNTSSGNYFNLKYASTLSVFDALAYKSIGVDVAKVATLFNGQIQRIKLLDNYDTGRTEYPVNGRDVVELDGLTQYAEIPIVSGVEVVVEFDVYLDGNQAGVPYLIASSIDDSQRVYLDSSEQPVFGSQLSVKVGGVSIASGAFKLEPNVVYSFEVSGVESIDRIAVQWNADNNFLKGWIANLRINGNNINRHYPLDRADIIQATPVLQEVPIQYDTNGTVTYDWADDTYFDYLTEVDSKYGDVAADINEAQARAAEGDVENGDFRLGVGDFIPDNGGCTTSVADGVLGMVNVGEGTSMFTKPATGDLEVGADYVLRLQARRTVGVGNIYVNASLSGAADTVATPSLNEWYDLEVAFTASVLIDIVQLGSSSGNAVGDTVEFRGVSLRKVTNKVVTERTISSEGVFDGNWINAPEPKYRPNNSIDINTVKRSKDAPSASDNLLINSLGSVGDELVDFSLAVIAGGSPTIGVEDEVISDTGTSGLVDFGGAVSGLGLSNGDVCTLGFYVSVDSGSAGLSINSCFGGNPVEERFYGGEQQVFVDLAVTDSSAPIKFGFSSATGSVSGITVRKTTRNIGEIKNLTGYQPVLKGGGLNRENVPDKFEAFNGDFTNVDYTLGVKFNAMTALASSGAEGSYDTTTGVEVGDVLVSKSAVVKSVATLNASTFQFTTLQGTDEQIQKGFEYPNVFRVIKPTDTSGEYEHYNTGGTYPWIP